MGHYHGYNDCRHGCEWGNYQHYKPEDNMKDNTKIKITIVLKPAPYIDELKVVQRTEEIEVELGEFNYVPDFGWDIASITIGTL